MSLTDNFNKFREHNSGQDIVFYETQGSVRNLCFVQPDGTRLFLNYAYLVSGEYLPKENSLTLVFTTHTVVLTGNNLESLHESLASHVPKVITCIDQRYAETKPEGEIVVTGIEVVRV